MTGPDDDRKPVEARFSYMWRRMDNQWKIVHHHSSASPKAPKAEEVEKELQGEALYPLAQENFKKWNDALGTRLHVNSQWHFFYMSTLQRGRASFDDGHPVPQRVFRHVN
jgi:hypothetical protein